MENLLEAGTVEIAKWIRKQLKLEFPECRWSVTTSHRKIYVTFLAGDFDPFESDTSSKGHEINGYWQILG